MSARPRKTFKRQRVDRLTDLRINDQAIHRDACLLDRLKVAYRKNATRRGAPNPLAIRPSLYSRLRGDGYPLKGPKGERPPRWRELSPWMKVQMATMVMAEDGYMVFTIHLHDEIRMELERTGACQKDCLDWVREGDTLVVTRLDRLARSGRDLHDIIAHLSAKHVGFRCLQQGAVDTTTSMGKLILGILGAVAEFETDIRKERQREGIERAKTAGVYKGRRSTIDPARVRSLRDEGLGATEIARKLGIARASVYRALKDEALGEA